MTVIVQPTSPPATLGTFIGRERELNEISGLFVGQAARLVTLTGAGGCGKTRLALAGRRRAARSASRTASGWWSWRRWPTPALVPQAVAAVLGVREEPRPARSWTALADYLQRQGAAAGAGQLRAPARGLRRSWRDALLRPCPRLRILATSREPLGVAGEVVWRVPSLALPDPDQLPRRRRAGCDPKPCSCSSSAPQAVLPDFALTADNAAAVAQICRRLDGIPLAIELAAARVAAADGRADRRPAGRPLPPADRRQPHRACRASRPCAPRSIGATTCSSAGAAVLLRRLAVFAGGCTLEAAERSAHDNSRQPPGSPAAGDVLDRLI